LLNRNGSQKGNDQDMITVSSDTIVKMWLSASAQIKANHEYLSKLDSVLGDGDHGISILRVMQVMEQTLADQAAASLQAKFAEVSTAVMMADAGSTSPLLGSFFEGFSEAATKESYTIAELAGLFEAGLKSLQALGKAQPGDKTSIDAWVPAVAAMRANADADLKTAMQAAAKAAKAGAVSTKEMVAKFGRARNYGEKSRGSEDAGANSVAFFFIGFAEGL
jgi:dihydroxyacetone kinase-like protein